MHHCTNPEPNRTNGELTNERTNHGPSDRYDAGNRVLHDLRRDISGR